MEMHDLRLDCQKGSKKVNVFVWRVTLDPNQSKEALNNRGMLVSTTCSICNSDEESSDPILTECLLTTKCGMLYQYHDVTTNHNI